MGRNCGFQGRSIAMFKRLDEAAVDWKSLSDLATILEEEFGREYGRARRIVNTWYETRCCRVNRVKAGRFVFFSSSPEKAPDVTVLAERYWGQLPVTFRRTHKFFGISPDEKLHAVLLAYGYFVHGRKDCLTAFNKWAESHGEYKIQKTLTHD